MSLPTTQAFRSTVLYPARDELLEVVAGLRNDGYDMVIDLTAVDYVAHPGRTDLPEGVVGERFEVVVLLIHHRSRERARIRVQVPEEDPVVPSLFDLYPGTEAMEREVHDLYGVAFEGHPDPTRILMPEDWDGHPLRKDVVVGTIPVQFKSPAER